MTSRWVAASVLFTVGLATIGCRRQSPQAGSAVDAGPASDSSASADTLSTQPREVRLYQGEPTNDEQTESACSRRTPLFGETIAEPEGGFLGIVPFGEDLIVGEKDRVLRRAGADGSKQVLLEQPGLVSMDRQGDDLLLLAKDAGRTWIERHPIARPSTVTAHRDVITKYKGDILRGQGWYFLDAIQRYSPDQADTGMKWGDFVEAGHVDASRTWKIDLPDERLGGRFAGFQATSKHLFWWVRDVRPEDAITGKESDFRIHSIEPDGRRNVWRMIERLVTAFGVDEERVDGPRVAWMDDSEGPCDSDVRPHKGVLWVAPLAAGAPKRILGCQVCARTILLKGDDIFWGTETGAVWWASVRTGHHLLVSGACDHAWVYPSDRWVYIERNGSEAGSRELVRVPWWR
jgi:hypothetical protein